MIIESIRDRMLVLSGDTVVHTSHRESTTIGAEAPHLDAGSVPVTSTPSPTSAIQTCYSIIELREPTSANRERLTL
jgi:hypothetical protein